MNRLILKQKKKERQKQKPIIITDAIIKNRLLRHFQTKIGEVNKTTKLEIFEACMGFNPDAFDSYARIYWEEKIQKIIKRLRSKRCNECFIIKKNGCFFVAKEESEAEFYCNRNENTKDKLDDANDRVREWVEQEKWKDFEKREIPDDENVKPEPPIVKPSGLDDYRNKIKTKVIKLWKGEKDAV